MRSLVYVIYTSFTYVILYPLLRTRTRSLLATPKCNVDIVNTKTIVDTYIFAKWLSKTYT